MIPVTGELRKMLDEYDAHVADCKPCDDWQQQVLDNAEGPTVRGLLLHPDCEWAKAFSVRFSAQLCAQLQ